MARRLALILSYMVLLVLFQASLLVWPRRCLSSVAPVLVLVPQIAIALFFARRLVGPRPLQALGFRRRGLLTGVCLALVIFIVAESHVAVGWGLKVINFTKERYEPGLGFALAMLARLVWLFVLSLLGSDLFFRGVLLGQRGGRGFALIFPIGVLGAAIWEIPLWWFGGDFHTTGNFVDFFVRQVLFAVVLGLLFLATGNLWATALAHALLLFPPRIFLADIESAFQTPNYIVIASSIARPLHYAALGLACIIAAAAAWLMRRATIQSTGD